MNVPSWIKGFFQEGLGNLNLISGGSKGVYFTKLNIESEERYFAIPFGYGHSMINKLDYEDDFGLKIVLNLAGKIRKIERRTLSSTPKNTVEQLSKIGELSDFGMDIEQDLIEEITAKPTDAYFGDNLVTGKVAFTVSVKVDIGNVKEFLTKCFEYYQKKDYQQRFAFFDQIKEIRDTEEWDSRLIDQLKGNDDENVLVWMAIPEIIDWEDVAGFSYCNKKENLESDLLLQDFKESLSPSKIVKLDVDSLKKKSISCFSSSSDQEIVSWPVFNCLYCEISHEGRKILLSNGKWYEIAKDFVEAVETSYKKTISDSSEISFITCDEKEYEGSYNIRLSKEIGGILMDKKNISYGGGSSSVEFCDVYAEEKHAFIHIKNYYGSSALSHLFAQGKVSGELFLADQKFRREVREKEGRLSFDPEITPNASDHMIIFGIISESNKPLNIPFFSKVNFRNTKRALNTFGYRNVYLTKIQRVKELEE